jgi:hypothetical protein
MVGGVVYAGVGLLVGRLGEELVYIGNLGYSGLWILRQVLAGRTVPLVNLTNEVRHPTISLSSALSHCEFYRGAEE